MLLLWCCGARHAVEIRLEETWSGVDTRTHAKHARFLPYAVKAKHYLNVITVLLVSLVMVMVTVNGKQ